MTSADSGPGARLAGALLSFSAVLFSLAATAQVIATAAGRGDGSSPWLSATILLFGATLGASRSLPAPARLIAGGACLPPLASAAVVALLTLPTGNFARFFEVMDLLASSVLVLVACAAASRYITEQLAQSREAAGTRHPAL